MTKDTRPSGLGPLRIFPKRARVFRDPTQFCPKILELLADGSPPFFALAAERAGVPRATAKSWYYEGLDRWHEYLTPWAEEVQQIRAEYMAQLLNRLSTCEDKIQHMNLTWILQRLDRENFDPPKQILQRVDVIPEAPAPEPAQLESDTQSTLEEPEP